MKDYLVALTSISAGEGSETNHGSLDKLMVIFRSPVFYITVGALILLIILVYFIRRFIKVAPNTATVTKKGKAIIILDSSDKRHFLIPFIEKVVVTLPLYEQDSEGDQLFINDGPDKLYKINYSIKFKVVDANKFYHFYNGFNKYFENTINEKLREYSEEMGASFILKDFSKNKNEIIAYLNKVFEESAIVILDMKIKAIEPVGVRVE